MASILVVASSFLLVLLSTGTQSYGTSPEMLLKNRGKVKEMFMHAYDSYMTYAYPLDELQPLTCSGKNTWGSFSLSLIDSMDTLLAMGNVSEFQSAYNRVISKPSFDIDVNTSVFEANIRVVGGLLSSHLLSHVGQVPLAPGWPCEGPLLRMAESLARRLLPAFDTPTGLPYGTVNLRYGVPPQETPITCTASCASFLVEFGTLSRLTGDPIFETTALKAARAIWAKRSSIGLVGNHINVLTGKWTATEFTMGNYIDSYLEYLVKGGILFGHKDLLDMFKEILVPIKKYTDHNSWYVWVDKENGKVSYPYYEALDSYWPGLLSLVGNIKDAKKNIFNHFLVWRSLGGLPEMLNIITGETVTGREAYRLRPELAESLYYLYQATGNPIFISMGEHMINSINNIARVHCGFATVRSALDHTLSDRMESYFLAETLKYLYLLFDPNHFLSLDPTKAVNVTETLRVPGSQHFLYNKYNRILKDGCSVGNSGYIFSTEAHPIDVGALYCCRRKWKDGMVEGDGFSSQDGCQAQTFESRLELFTAGISE